MRFVRDLFIGAVAATLSGAAFAWAYYKLQPPPELPPTIYCRTGAGPFALDGFDWEAGVHPLFSDVWVLMWKTHPGDTAWQSAALQPPFECRELGTMNIQSNDGTSEEVGP